MLTEEAYIEKVRKAIEDRLGWGDSRDWTHSDFIALSEKIAEETKASLSPVTLKRIWGKVKYNSLPNAYTLNVLAVMAGYENWRAFKGDHPPAAPIPEVPEPVPAPLPENPSAPVVRRKWLFGLAGIWIAVTAGLFWRASSQNQKTAPARYAFSSKKVVTRGVPNTVIFDYDASQAPTDSVIIQQSWDRKLRSTVSKKGRQHTSIYYLPDHYQAKLVVNQKVVKEHSLLIQSDGWLAAVLYTKVPVYLKKEEVLRNGALSLPVETLQQKGIPLLPEPPTTLYSNVQDLGPVYTDDFVFETVVRNDYRDGNAACQKTNLYLLCEGTAIGIPLCSPGCVSDIDLLFTDYFISGKRSDLSAFGVDFQKSIPVRVESKGGTARIYLNGKLAYQVNEKIRKARIVGFDLVFQGTGTVESVRLCNDQVRFEDDFQ